MSTLRSPLDRLLVVLGALGLGTRLLYLRPSSFTGLLLARPRPIATALFAWTWGIWYVLEVRTNREARGKSFPFTDDWYQHWLFLVVVGALAGVLVHRFGGWWFEVRLWLSGVNPIDEARARLVCFATAQVQTLPTIVWTLGETLLFESPDAVTIDAQRVKLVLFVFAFWSVVSTYLSVRAAFGGRRWLVVFWFVVLPASWFLLVFAGAATWRLLLAGDA